MELAGAKAAVLRGTPFGDVCPQLRTDGERHALRAWFVRAPGVPVKPADRPKARDFGFTGDACAICSSMRVVRNGSCVLCLECGSTTGCS